jgi:hypothetical protein
MQAEIMQRGPIICSMQTEDDGGAIDPPPSADGHYWHCYEGGVYRTNRTFHGTNHVISLLGWGVDAGVDYWVGRHSVRSPRRISCRLSFVYFARVSIFQTQSLLPCMHARLCMQGGTIFGEEGFFRIERGVNALNIETSCGWVAQLNPDFSAFGSGKCAVDFPRRIMTMCWP